MSTSAPFSLNSSETLARNERRYAGTGESLVTFLSDDHSLASLFHGHRCPDLMNNLHLNVFIRVVF